MTLNELSGETDFDAAVTINSGGALSVNDPTTYISDHSGGSIVVNGMLNLSGTIVQISAGPAARWATSIVRAD